MQKLKLATFNGEINILFVQMHSCVYILAYVSPTLLTKMTCIRFTLGYSTNTYPVV